MRILRLLAAFLMASALAGASELAIKLDKNEQIPNAQNTIIEVFSYGCVHCANHFFGGTLKSLAEMMDGFEVKMWQVEQMGQWGAQMAAILAYAEHLDSAAKTNILSKNSTTHRVLDAHFKAEFRAKKIAANEDDFYAISGLNASEIKAWASTSEGEAAIKRMRDGFGVAKRAGTPGFVINGKWLINLANVRSMEDLVEAARWASEQKD